MKNKKLFAILTLLCFLFTLMPVAAFAGADDFSTTASVVATQKANVEVEVYEEVDAQITLKAVNNALFKAESTTKVYVWAETAANQISDAFAVKGVDAEAGTPGVYAVEVKEDKAVAEFVIEFYRAGNYTLKAAMENPALSADIEDVITFNGASAAFQTVKVSSKASDTKTWGVKVVTDDVNETLTDDKRTTENNVVVEQANGVKSEKVVLTVLTNAGAGQPVAGYPVKLDTNSSNIEVSDAELTTNHNGQVEFKVGGTREGVYKVYVTVGDLEVTVLVQVGSWISDSIEVIKAPKAPVAKDTGIASYEDLIRFQITDVNGNIVTDAWDYCTYANPDEEAAPYVTFVEKPAASKLKDKDLWIEQADDENYYVLALTSGKNFDVEGTYTVKVILDNGRFATVTWEVKKFQTPVEIVIDAPETVELGAIVDIDMTYVDANGVEKLAEKDADLTATGYAIAAFEAEDEAGMLVVKTDEKYVGSTITVTAVSERYNLVAVKEIKVAGEAKEIKFEKGSLAVNAYNKVKWNVVDENGNPVKLTDYVSYTSDIKAANNRAADVTIRYVVLDKPADAKVSVTDLTDKSPFDGDGVMALTSNKVGNVTVQAVAQVRFGVLLNGNDNIAMQTKYYTGTQIFAVGTAGVGDVVVMSVGSNEIIINDAKAVIEAAPIVENNRTFVPFRALIEAFGATVTFNEATQAVTAELNGTTVVMTIGSATYTVNGVEKTADVAPFINGSRTMVPVRFVAEAFGIKVIPTYDENGATADILFNL